MFSIYILASCDEKELAEQIMVEMEDVVNALDGNLLDSRIEYQGEE